MNIIKASINNAKELSFIIAQANKQVAKEFNLNINNCATHPSFCTRQWIEDDMKNQAEYFLYKKDDKFVACVSFVNPRESHAYLNRLCVLPDYQGQRIGEELVEFFISYAKKKDIKTIGIAIIKKHEKLKKWYVKLGFKKGDTKAHEHLPFEVLQMKYFIN